MSVSIAIEYLGDLHCQAIHKPSGTALVTDAPTDNGGKGELFSPTDLVATALGTCILTIMGLVAKRHDLDIRGTRIEVVKEMTAHPVRRIGSLAVRVVFPAGLNISDQVRTLFEKAAHGCPVKASLHPDVQLSFAFFWDKLS